MRTPPPIISKLLILCLSSAISMAAEDDINVLLLQLTNRKPDTVKAAIEKLALTGDPRIVGFFENFNKDNVYVYKDKIVVCPELKEVNDEKIGQIFDPLSGAPLKDEGGKDLVVKSDDLTEVSPGRQRTLIRDAITTLRLSDPNRDTRMNAIIRIADTSADSNLPALKSLLEREKDPKVKNVIKESICRIELNSKDMAVRMAAAKELGVMSSGRALDKLKELVAGQKVDSKVVLPEPAEAKVYQSAIDSIESWGSITRSIKYIFDGISLGSILVLMALGLSIIFGLMGVINMAHGELMMIGAYSTYVTQLMLAKAMPETYFLVAIPVSFLVAALAGYLMEVLVIRHLYGRPLETLLATWGVSLILIQIARVQFGDNVGVNSPTWLQGGAEVLQGVVLPYNRCFIIGFCLFCILLMYFIIDKTKLGLLLRATTQNRGMAASLGVRTRRIDGYTFALGAGLAGLAGCAITLTDGVRPDMGQNYIVDSFLVVVTGGVGKLAGAVWAGMGLGCLNKIYEPFVGAVVAKVLILACIVLFIQWKPSGLFPAKGRTADA
jgi:urea transport system permease protein